MDENYENQSNTNLDDNQTNSNQRSMNADNPDGIGIADAYMTGSVVKDARKAETERKENPEKSREGFTADLVASLVNGISNVPDGLAT